MADSGLSKIKDARERVSANARVKGKIDISIDELIDLAQDSNQLVAHPDRVRATLNFGLNQSVRRGQGMEYAESRPWVAGDDVRNMDWRVTARTGRPHTKLFEDERDQPWIVVVDLRSAMAFGSRTRFKSVQAARVAALLSWAGTSLGNRVGGAVLTDTGLRVLPASRGRSSVMRFFKAMSSVVIPEDRRAVVDPPNFGVFDRLYASAPETSVVFIISDFSGFSNESFREIARIGATRSLVAIRIADALETLELPKGRYPVTDGERRNMVGIAGDEDRTSWLGAMTAIAETAKKRVASTGARYATVTAHDDPVLELRRLLNNETDVQDTGTDS